MEPGIADGAFRADVPFSEVHFSGKLDTHRKMQKQPDVF
jgi:hypothetical protein